ncbi:MAG: ABC transporter ATP-binding protein [Acidimicrobiales bacterium]
MLSVKDLRVLHTGPDGEEALVHGVSFEVSPRQTVAIVGESGSGKSLSALAIMRLTGPGMRVTAETLRIGTVDLLSLREPELRDIRGARIAIVFQNPMSSLNPVLTVGHQLVQAIRGHERLNRRRARERAVELLALVEVPEPHRRYEQYPFELSGGTLQRVMIAMALSAQPELLIADEPTTALDATLQAQIMELLKMRQRDLGMGLLLISHDLAVVAHAADEVVVMYGGRVVEHGDVQSVFHDPLHPYTCALLATVKEMSSDGEGDLHPIPGLPPRLDRLPVGCPFAPRCPKAIERCRVESPSLRSATETHDVACHRWGE